MKANKRWKKLKEKERLKQEAKKLDIQCPFCDHKKVRLKRVKGETRRICKRCHNDITEVNEVSVNDKKKVVEKVKKEKKEKGWFRGWLGGGR